MSSSLKPAVEKLNLMFGLNATLRRLSKAACSRVFFSFFEVDAADGGREDVASELASLLDLAFEASPPELLSFDCAGTVFVATGLATEDEVA